MLTGQFVNAVSPLVHPSSGGDELNRVKHLRVTVFIKVEILNANIEAIVADLSGSQRTTAIFTVASVIKLSGNAVIKTLSVRTQNHVRQEVDHCPVVQGEGGEAIHTLFS